MIEDTLLMFILMLPLIIIGGYHFVHIHIDYWNQYCSRKERIKELKRLRKELRFLSREEFKDAIKSYF